MIPADGIDKLIMHSKSTHLRVKDLSGHVIFEIAQTNPGAAIKELDDMMELLSQYGRIIIQGGTAATALGKWKGGNEWTVYFEKDKKSVANPWANWNAPIAGMPPGFQNIPVGYVHQDVMNAKLEMIQKEMTFNNKINQLERKIEEGNKNPMDQYIGYMPYVMKLLGQDPADIKEMMQYSSMSRVGNHVQQAPTNTLKFEDVEKMDADQKNVEIGKLMAELAEKISGEQMIVVLRGLNKSTIDLTQETTDIAILAMVLADQVGADTMKQLLTGLSKKPDMAALALNYLK